MELIHKLYYHGGNDIIDEPIGFDDLKMTLKRHDYHGIGAEMSLGNLEFYGAAFQIIKQCYETDIDEEVWYIVLNSDGTRIFEGMIDLSTYSVKQGDYQSVSVKVGEIGEKTTFNNRLDTEVDLNAPKTVDGDPVEAPDWLNLHIPMKHLLYTNYSKQRTDSDRYRYATAVNSPYPYETDKYLELPIGNDDKIEFGSMQQVSMYFSDELSFLAEQYTAGPDETEFINLFGNEPTTNIIVSLKFTINVTILKAYEVNHGWIDGDGSFWTFALKAIDGKGNIISGSIQTLDKVFYNIDYDIELTLDGQLRADSAILYYIQVNNGFNLYNRDIGSMDCQFSFKVNKGSFVKMTMYDNLTENTPVNADMLLAHDALNIVSHAISENALSVKSEWYRTPDSKWNAGSIGSGALKALTNGYHIRGLFTDSETERNMPMSFKSLIESLNAQDCIGWGFATENGELCVRVERWSWFYQDTVILTLNNVAEVQIDIDPDRIITELKIGYKKYATNDQYNSIDSPHGTRTFVNGIKAVSKTETQECDFIADNYAIEEIRRAAVNENETKENTYDESIFLFELTEKQGVYSIGHTAYNAEGIGNAQEFINAKLTPRHMASRWKDYIFAANNATPFKFTAGELNYKASFLVLPEYLNAVHSLKPFYGRITAASENEDIDYEHAIFTAEKITFSYPLTIAQYNEVKANPYGLISVNGRLGWIIDFKYSFADGMADFVLLSKYE